MLMPLPATLRRLVAEYETLLAAETLGGATPPSQRLRDLAYTLCVSTGTREIADALDTARSYLAARTTVTSAADSVAGARPGPGRRAAAASPKPAAVAAAGLHRDAGEPSAGRRDVMLRPGQRPTAPSVVSAGKDSGG
ncbi:DUF5133 domain-containing protein [Streptomyces sp. NPDC002688]|uniref:DUF5133 domain-containing protein n=1 Tax=Streptomyces sp. NPDC002688 TaxID=3154423 RepID=UPI00331FDC32